MNARPTVEGNWFAQIYTECRGFRQGLWIMAMRAAARRWRRRARRVAPPMGALRGARCGVDTDPLGGVWGGRSY